MFDWLRKRRTARDIPDGLWRDLLTRYPFIASRPTAELARLRELAAQFLATKEFHGANGLVITDAVALAIAAQAVRPSSISAWPGTTTSWASWCIRGKCSRAEP
jgi:Mlc titration factor MtfA (ptsG expression regulator)